MGRHRDQHQDGQADRKFCHGRPQTMLPPHGAMSIREVRAMMM